jgi:hypothetical protein
MLRMLPAKGLFVEEPPLWEERLLAVLAWELLLDLVQDGVNGIFSPASATFPCITWPASMLSIANPFGLYNTSFMVSLL